MDMPIIQNEGMHSQVLTQLKFPRPLFYFDFHVNFRRVNDDGSFNIRSVKIARECERSLVMEGDDEAKRRICEILTSIGVPCYFQLVEDFNLRLIRAHIDGDANQHCLKMAVHLEVQIVGEFPGIMCLEEANFTVPSEIPRHAPPGNPMAIQCLLSPHEPPEEVDVNETCSICHETLVYGTDECVRLPMCSLPHIFHRPCISEWLENTSSCPICREFFPI